MEHKKMSVGLALAVMLFGMVISASAKETMLETAEEKETALMPYCDFREDGSPSSDAGNTTHKAGKVDEITGFKVADKNKEAPFYVSVDKTALEIGSVERATAIITAEAENWNYSVKAENGKISDKKNHSFVYTKPTDEKCKEDEITVEFVDEDSGASYNMVISLIFTQAVNQEDFVVISYP